jgi:hypothetical protein
MTPPRPKEWVVIKKIVRYVALADVPQPHDACKTSINAVETTNGELQVKRFKQGVTSVYVPLPWVQERNHELYDLQLRRPPTAPGKAPIYQVSGAKDSWLRVADLEQQATPTLIEFLDVVKPKIKCIWNLTAAPLPIKVLPGYRLPSEPFIPLWTIRKAFPFLMLEGDVDPTPETRTYVENLSISRTWIPSLYIEEILDEIEIEDLAQKGEKWAPKAAIFAKVVADHRIKSCRKNNPLGYWFFDPALLVSHSDEVRDSVHSLIAPNCVQPQLPSYAIEDQPGMYIPAPCLRRFCVNDETLRDIFPDDELTDLAAMKEVPGLKSGHISAAVENGSLKKVDGKNATGGLMISATRIAKHKRLKQLVDHIGQGHPKLPIQRSDPPTRNRQGDKEYAEAKKCSVKMGLSKMLNDKQSGIILDTLVKTVSYMSRYGSLLIQLDILNRLEQGNGHLDKPFKLTNTYVSNAMMCARNFRQPNARKFPELRAMAEKYAGSLDKLKVEYTPGLTNSIIYEASQYVTSTSNSINEQGENRINRVFDACMRLLDIKDKTLVSKCRNFVRDGTRIPNDLPQRLRLMLDKYRAMYVEKNLDGPEKFYINQLSGAERDARFSRIMELFYEINKDLVDLESEAVESGLWKPSSGTYISTRPAGFESDMFYDDEDEDTDLQTGAQLETPNTTKEIRFWKRGSFSLVSVNDLRNRTVRIDNNVWAGYVYDELYDMNIEGLQEDAFSSLFAVGKSGRGDITKIRSSAKGWKLGKSFTTDGVVLNMTYFNPLMVATPEEKKLAKGKVDPEAAFAPIDEDSIKIGLDAGVVNILQIAWEIDGQLHKIVYTSKEHYEKGHINRVAKAREHRVAEFAKEAMEAISNTRKKTGNLGEFENYVRMYNVHHDALWKVFGGKTSCWERFEMYRNKMASFDGFWKKVRFMIASKKKWKDPDKQNRPKVTVGWGNAKFKGSMVGCKPVPTCSMSRRVRATMGQFFDIRMVDEFRTTVMCCKCETRLETGKRLRKMRGNFGWYEDRDVKWCNTPSCLESHSCSASKKLVKGAKKVQGARAVDRDVNSALAHATLVGRRNVDRPHAYQRPVAMN